MSQAILRRSTRRLVRRCRESDCKTHQMRVDVRRPTVTELVMRTRSGPVPWAHAVTDERPLPTLRVPAGDAAAPARRTADPC